MNVNLDIKIEGKYFRIEEKKTEIVSTTEALQTLKDIKKVVRQRLEYAKGTKDGYSEQSREELDAKLKEIANSIMDLHNNESEQTFNQIKALVNRIENLLLSPLLQMPGELILHIFSFLKINQIRNSFTVSRDVYAYAQRVFRGKVKICIEMNSTSQGALNKKVYDFAVQGNSREVRMLLECGAKPDGFIDRIKYECSALILAAKANYPCCVRLLLSYGANVNRLSEQRDTALFWAVYNGNFEMVKDLLEYGADPNSAGTPTTCLLNWGCTKKDWKILELLVRSGANLNQKDDSGHSFSILHIAAHKGDAELVKFLLEHGADSTITDSLGATPLQIAEEVSQNRNQEVITLLKSVNHKIDDKKEKPS
jgi:hypothetical protein